jgi:hypothetical protein
MSDVLTARSVGDTNALIGVATYFAQESVCPLVAVDNSDGCRLMTGLVTKSAADPLPHVGIDTARDWDAKTPVRVLVIWVVVGAVGGEPLGAEDIGVDDAAVDVQDVFLRMKVLPASDLYRSYAEGNIRRQIEDRGRCSGLFVYGVTREDVADRERLYVELGARHSGRKSAGVNDLDRYRHHVFGFKFQMDDLDSDPWALIQSEIAESRSVGSGGCFSSLRGGDGAFFGSTGKFLRASGEPSGAGVAVFDGLAGRGVVCPSLIQQINGDLPLLGGILDIRPSQPSYRNGRDSGEYARSAGPVDFVIRHLRHCSTRPHKSAGALLNALGDICAAIGLVCLIVAGKSIVHVLSSEVLFCLSFYCINFGLGMFGLSLQPCPWSQVSGSGSLLGSRNSAIFSSASFFGTVTSLRSKSSKRENSDAGTVGGAFFPMPMSLRQPVRGTLHQARATPKVLLSQVCRYLYRCARVSGAARVHPWVQLRGTLTR